MTEVNVNDVRKALNYLRGTVHQESVWNLLDEWMRLGSTVHAWLDNAEDELPEGDGLPSTVAAKEQSVPCGNMLLGALQERQGFTCSEPAVEVVDVPWSQFRPPLPLSLCTYHADKFRLQQLMASETASGESF